MQQSLLDWRESAHIPGCCDVQEGAEMTGDELSALGKTVYGAHGMLYVPCCSLMHEVWAFSDGSTLCLGERFSFTVYFPVVSNGESGEWVSSPTQVPYKSHSQVPSARQVVVKGVSVETGSAFSSLPVFLPPSRPV